MTDLSVDLQSYNGVEDDAKEEEEERDEQLNGILSTYFDDLSSLSDESCASDDLLKSEDEENEFLNTREKGPAFGDSFESSWPKFNAGQTSTPLYHSQPHRRHSVKTDVIVEVDEVDSSDFKVNGNGNSLEGKSSSSVENGRFASSHLKRSIFGEDVGHFSSKHQQMLLDENEHLTSELSTLKHQLSVRSGDYEGLRHKYSELEKAFQDKDSTIIQLTGKISALEVQLRLETEAKEEFSRKLRIAEATIEPLQRQLSELAKSDNLSRIRDAHEAYVSRIKNDYENEIFALNEEITKLNAEKWEMESNAVGNKCQSLVNNELSTTKGDTTDSFEAILLKKEEQICSLEKEVKQLNETIAQLTLQLSVKKTDVSPIKLAKGTVSFDSTVCDLKAELENALETLESRREQNNTLRLQLDSAKREIGVLKESLKAKEMEFKTELDKARSLTISKCQHDREVLALNKEITSLRKLNTEASEKVDELMEFKKKCAELEIVVDSLKTDSSEVKASYAQICNEKMEIEAAYNRFLRDFRHQCDFSDSNSKKLKEMVNISTELWKREVELKYAAQLNSELKKLREACAEEKAAEITRISKKFNKDMEDQVNVIMTTAQNVLQREELNDEVENIQLNTLFKPLQQFWVNFKMFYKEREALIVQETSELRVARQELKEAFNESLQNKSDYPLKCNCKEAVNELQQQLSVMNDKIKKYKKYYQLLLKKHETEVNQLKFACKNMT